VKGSKPDNIVVNVLSCAGDPTLAKVENLKEGHVHPDGLTAFARWFMSWMILPFQELQLEGIFLMRRNSNLTQTCWTSERSSGSCLEKRI
jgi:hypothetical protein